MRLVILESPYSAKGGLGSVKANIAYAHQCAKNCILRGESPIASHLLYTQFLDDTNPTERELGIALGLAWRRAADCSVFYIDHGWSTGMRAALESAKRLNLPWELRALSDETGIAPV